MSDSQSIKQKALSSVHASGVIWQAEHSLSGILH